MKKLIKLALIASVLSFGIILGSIVLADETPSASPSPTETPAQVSPTPEPTDVPASALGINDPKILPDSPFYFLKEWKRGIQSFFTVNALKKTEMAEKFANEKLVELQKLTEKGVSQEIIQKAAEKYQKQVEKVKTLSEKIKGTAENNPEVAKFLDKFTQQQNLQEQILQKLEQQVPATVLQKIKDARENHLEKFKQVMQKLETRKDQVKEKLNQVCTQIYSPVCGRDGKTYGNKCLAKIAGIEIASQGACPIGAIACQTDSDCPQPLCGPAITTNAAAAQCLRAVSKCVDKKCVLQNESLDQKCQNYYWIDNTNKECGYKQFCGLYIYQGLRTFATKAQCLKATSATPTPAVSPSPAAQ